MDTSSQYKNYTPAFLGNYNVSLLPRDKKSQKKNLFANNLAIAVSNKSKQKSAALHVLLADDDKDDRFFFDTALKELPIPTQLETVEDGEKLMNFLKKNSNKLPDVLFLDLNMPRKNGSECLLEIKANKKLKQLPVIIYSTSLHTDMADVLYKNGAHYYVRKTELGELIEHLLRIFTLLVEKKFARPTREEFIINGVNV